MDVQSHTNKRCDKCNRIFVSRKGLQNHIESVHEKRRFQCKQCEKTFAQNGILTTHVKSYHEGERHKCDKCDNMFSTRGNLIITRNRDMKM